MVRSHDDNANDYNSKDDTKRTGTAAGISVLEFYCALNQTEGSPLFGPRPCHLRELLCPAAFYALRSSSTTGAVAKNAPSKLSHAR